MRRLNGFGKVLTCIEVMIFVVMNFIRCTDMNCLNFWSEDLPISNLKGVEQLLFL